MDSQLPAEVDYFAKFRNELEIRIFIPESYCTGSIFETMLGFAEWYVRVDMLCSACDPCYRGTSLIRNQPPLGTYSRTKPRALW